jgi:hypothetical protein
MLAVDNWKTSDARSFVPYADMRKEAEHGHETGIAGSIVRNIGVLVSSCRV